MTEGYFKFVPVEKFGKNAMMDKYSLCLKVGDKWVALHTDYLMKLKGISNGLKQFCKAHGIELKEEDGGS